jgi:uncharacterized membrane protein
MTMNRSMMIPALVAALSLGACETSAVGDAAVAFSGPAQPHGPIGNQGNQGIVAGTGGSGAGVMAGRMPIAGSAPATESKYSLTSARRDP